MDPRDFLRHAEATAEHPDAASQRTALSRAYYATYNVAADLLRALRLRLPPGHAGHEVVRDYLLHSGHSSMQRAAAALANLQSLRVKADYVLRDPHPERPPVVREALARAGRTIADLDAIVADPAARARMSAAIRAWRRGAGGPP